MYSNDFGKNVLCDSTLDVLLEEHMRSVFQWKPYALSHSTRTNCDLESMGKNGEGMLPLSFKENQFRRTT